MRRLKALDLESAAGRSQEMLADIVARHGSVGEMAATMAHSPATLQGYLELSRAMKRVKIPRALSEKISLALQEWIGCGTCMAAHIEAGRTAGLSEQDIALARQGTSADAREATLIATALRVLAEPASIADDEIEQLRALGWSDRILSELPGLAALNLLTGSFNLLAGLQPEPTDSA